MFSFRTQSSRQILATLGAVTVALTTAATSAAAGTPLNVSTNGSTTVYPIANDNIGGFQGIFNDTSIIQTDGGPAGIAQPGSGAGIANLLKNTIDVANASRPTQSSDNVSGNTFSTSQVDQWVVGLDGISMAVNNNGAGAVPSDITSLTVTQIKGIYSCTFTNWNQVGSHTSAPIVAFSRSSASGTYADFNKFIGISAPGSCVQTANPDSNPGMLSEVQANANSIAYMGIGFAYSDTVHQTPATNVRVLKVDNVQPTPASVVSAIQTLTGSSPFSQSPAPDTAPNGTEYVFGRQLFMDTIQASALPAAGTRSTDYARAIQWVNYALDGPLGPNLSQTGQGQQNVLTEGEIGLTTQNPTVDPTFSKACVSGSSGSYCPQLIPPWNVTVSGVTNVNDVVAVGLNWQATAPAGELCGWIRADVTCSGVVNVNQVVKIGLHWQETWARWVD